MVEGVASSNARQKLYVPAEEGPGGVPLAGMPVSALGAVPVIISAALEERALGYLRDVWRLLEGHASHAWAWVTARPGYPFDAAGAAFLLVGGISTLGLLALLVGVQAALSPAPRDTSREPPPRVHTALRLAAPAEGSHAFRASPLEEFQQGRTAGTRARAGDLDALLDDVVGAGLGEPRILRRLPHMMLVRLHACRGCVRGPEEQGCGFECGFLEAGFAQLWGPGVVVREVACGTGSSNACDYEVWH